MKQLLITTLLILVIFENFFFNIMPNFDGSPFCLITRYLCIKIYVGFYAQMSLILNTPSRSIQAEYDILEWLTWSPNILGLTMSQSSPHKLASALFLSTVRRQFLCKKILAAVLSRASKRQQTNFRKLKEDINFTSGNDTVAMIWIDPCSNGTKETPESLIWLNLGQIFL